MAEPVELIVPLNKKIGYHWDLHGRTNLVYSGTEIVNRISLGSSWQNQSSYSGNEIVNRDLYGRTSLVFSDTE